MDYIQVFFMIPGEMAFFASFAVLAYYAIYVGLTVYERYAGAQVLKDEIDRLRCLAETYYEFASLKAKENDQLLNLTVRQREQISYLVEAPRTAYRSLSYGEEDTQISARQVYG